MKVLNDGSTKGTTFALILDKKEARLLVDMAGAASNAHKRKSSFRNLKKKLEAELWCF